MTTLSEGMRSRDLFKGLDEAFSASSPVTTDGRFAAPATSSVMTWT